MFSKAVPALEFRELAEFGDIQSGDSPGYWKKRKWAMPTGDSSDLFLPLLSRWLVCQTRKKGCQMLRSLQQLQ